MFKSLIQYGDLQRSQDFRYKVLSLFFCDFLYGEMMSCFSTKLVTFFMFSLILYPLIL